MKTNKLQPQILQMLSQKGTEAFFPSQGILAQTNEARKTEFNATIGAAKEENGSVMCLNSIRGKIYIDPEKCFPYAPSFGRKDLRETWEKMIREKNPRLGDTKISLPIITSALTHGLSIIGHLFVEEGEEVISPDLFWGNYKLIFEHWHCGKIKTFKTFSEIGFNLEGLRESLLSEGEKKIVILNFPNNPSGYTPTQDEAQKIEEIILEAAQSGKKIVAIIDDAYFGLVYEEGIEKESIFARLADLHENVLAIKIDGATKEDYVWGLRIGFITYGFKGMTDLDAETLENKTAGAIRGNISNTSNLSQSLVLEAFSSPTYKLEKSEKYNILKSRYDEIKAIIDENPRFSEQFEPLPFNSGYFMCIELKNSAAEPVRKILIEMYSTGVIAMGNTIRIAFSSIPKAKLNQLFQNIYLAASEASRDHQPLTKTDAKYTQKPQPRRAI